jgi:hypothetical protein
MMKLKPNTSCGGPRGHLIYNNELYRCSTMSILKWCIPPEEGKALLLDVHEGICMHHSSSRSMVGKAYRQGFYCNCCQRHDADREILQVMPVLRYAGSCPCLGAPDDLHHLAFRCVGFGPSGTLQEGARELNPLARPN